MRELDSGLQVVDPAKLTVLLEETGWHLVGGRRNAYNRLAPPADPDGRDFSLVIPLDREAPEFAEMMAAAVRKISARDGQEWSARLLPRLIATETDEFRFRRETSLPSGLIKWRDGESLIQAARATLTAGAKAAVSKARRFGNRHGQFANRYLDHILMGQTAPGSYVVTAYALSEEPITLHQTSNQTLGIPGVDFMESREISRSVTNALGAAAEALAHFHANQSLAGFDAGVTQGISYELTSALAALTEDADEAEVFIEWHPSGEQERAVSERFDYSRRDSDAFQRAATRLVLTEPQPRTTVVGRVHLLTKKEAGQPGVIGIVSAGTAKPRRVRAHLVDAADYHLAVRAHEEDLMIEVVGDLEREGTLNWLYGAHIEATHGSATEPLPSASDAHELEVRRLWERTAESG
ncbi:hypothetical protein [Micromonospora sp. NPDC005171]|uniref:hypothetical protein n=1 Tax=Micromonospora sp. NPDC005171 TaxID=3156866 RepID=UPI0033A82C76